jgi:flavin-dependent dehydrogenase
VTLRTRDGQELRAPIVIAADGVNSVVARRLGLNPGWPANQLALDMMEETPTASLRTAEPDTLSVFYGYGGAHGYAYIFPKLEHVNVGIGYVLTYFKQRVDLTPYDLQQQFVGELRSRGMMDGASRREHFTPFLIPIVEDGIWPRAPRRRRRRVRERLFG